MKRLFIAINLAEEVKRQIIKIIKQISSDKFLDKSNFRWISPENWHLTISFLGYQPDEAIEPILQSIKETINKYSHILKNVGISFERVILAPPNRPPRMIWLLGSQETSKILGQIKNNLENNLIKNGVKFQRENRPYNAHLTLARFQSSLRNYENLRKYENFQLPNYQLPITFFVQSIDLMESHLKRTGAEYNVLAKLDFKE